MNEIFSAGSILSNILYYRYRSNYSISCTYPHRTIYLSQKNSSITIGIYIVKLINEVIRITFYTSIAHHNLVHFRLFTRWNLYVLRVLSLFWDIVLFVYEDLMLDHKDKQIVFNMLEPRCLALGRESEMSLARLPRITIIIRFDFNDFLSTLNGKHMKY